MSIDRRRLIGDRIVGIVHFCVRTGVTSMLKQRRIALIAGNGMTIDAMSLDPSVAKDWDPQRPLSWKLGTPDASDVPLTRSLPRFASAIAAADLQKLPTDFERFARLSSRFLEGDAANRAGHVSKHGSPELSYLEFQTRYFISVAYSHLQMQLDRLPLRSWKWTTWLRRNRGFIKCLVSFNYDLVMEDAIRFAGMELDRIQVRNGGFPGGIIALKPHGSVDFDVDSDALSIKFPFPLGNVAFVNSDFPMQTILRSKLLSFRTVGEVVLPMEYTRLSHVQWVAPAFRAVEETISTVDTVVIAGISYWVHDRAEILRLVDAAPWHAKIIVANPAPPHDLLRALHERGRTIELWHDGPE